MRLNAEAVMCRSNKEWFYGSVSGFTFYIKDKVKNKNFFKDTKRFITVSQWIIELGYKKKYDKLTKTLLKNIKIVDITNHNSKINYEKGIIRLFIGKTVNIGQLDYSNYNILCANCAWTCKKHKSYEIISCKEFNNVKPF